MALPADFKPSYTLLRDLSGLVWRFRDHNYLDRDAADYLLGRTETLLIEFVFKDPALKLKNLSNDKSIMEFFSKKFNRYKWRPYVSKFRINYPTESLALDVIFCKADAARKEWEANRDKAPKVYLDGRNNGD